jgi:CBS domain-containing protein
MTMTFDDEWTEATDANIPRVDLVGKAANGSAGFLLMKNTAGLLAPDTVRSLIKEAEDATGGTLTATQTTFTGSTGDVMKAIHAASLRQKDQAMPTVLKADDATQAAEVVLAGDEPLPTADEVASATPETAPGDPDDPTSAAWEAVDAARARQALQLTIALQRLVAEATDRESQEAAVGDADDLDGIWTLGDVSCAIDSIIALLAPFAITEQAEADQLAGEQIIKSLTKVLGTLPVTTDDDLPVAKTQKEAPVAIDTPTIEMVEKAKGDPLTPVYDENGKLVGMIDSTDLIAISPAGAAAPAEAPVEDTLEAPMEPVAAAATPEAPTPDEAVIPGTETVVAPAPVPDPTPIAKAQTEQVDSLTEALTTMAKQFDGHADLVAVVKGLQDRIEHLAKMPDDRKSPLLNGGTGMAGLSARDGQDLDSLATLRKAVEDAPDPVRKDQAQRALAFAAIKDRFKQ